MKHTACGLPITYCMLASPKSLALDLKPTAAFDLEENYLLILLQPLSSPLLSSQPPLSSHFSSDASSSPHSLHVQSYQSESLRNAFSPTCLWFASNLPNKTAPISSHSVSSLGWPKFRGKLAVPSIDSMGVRLRRRQQQNNLYPNISEAMKQMGTWQRRNKKHTTHLHIRSPFN